MQLERKSILKDMYAHSDILHGFIDFLRKIAYAKAQFIFISCHLLGKISHFSTIEVQCC